MAPNTSAVKTDVLTIGLISAMAASLNVAIHEGVHALACVLTGAELQEFSALYVECGDSAMVWQDKFISGSASIVNLIIGTLAWLYLRRAHNKSAPLKLFLWTYMAMNLLGGSGYWMLSGFGNIGDWANVIAGWEPHWAWRVGMAIFGSLVYMWMVWICMHALGRIIGGDAPERDKRALRIGIIIYISAILLTVAAAAISPLGINSLPGLAGIFATVGSSACFVWMMFWFTDKKIPKVADLAPLEVQRNIGWIIGAIAVVAAYIFILGPTLYF